MLSGCQLFRQRALWYAGPEVLGTKSEKEENKYSLHVIQPKKGHAITGGPPLVKLIKMGTRQSKIGLFQD